jgi:hypothetical protein
MRRHERRSDCPEIRIEVSFLISPEPARTELLRGRPPYDLKMPARGYLQVASLFENS